MGRLATLRRHWAIALVLTFGLALRLPHTAHGHYEDIANYARVATWLTTPGQFLDLYHNGYARAFPYAHPPLGPIVFAPFHALAVWLGFSYFAAFHYLMYAFEAGAAIFLYLLARTYRTRQDLEGALGPPLVAGTWFLGLVSPLWLDGGSAVPDSNFTSMSTALVLGAIWSQGNPGRAGLFYGLALATRTETALLALPWTLHYANRNWTLAARFLGASVLTCGGIVLPFLLRDPAAFDWALRGHIVQRLADDLPLMWRGLVGTPLAPLGEMVRPANSLVMLGAVIVSTLAFAREPLLERRLALIGLTHALTMPVFHMRYALATFGIGLAYAAHAGALRRMVAWSLATAAASVSALTLIPVWIGLAWESARARTMDGDDSDPVRAGVMRWLESAPAWRVPAAMAIAFLLAGVARASVVPRADDATMLALLGRVVGTAADGPAPLALVSWIVKHTPIGTPAWRINAVPAVAAALSVLAAGVITGWAWERLRTRREAHVSAAFVTAVVAVSAARLVGLLGGRSEGETYHSLAVANLEQLERDAFICVGGPEAGLWAYAQQVDDLRRDVRVAAAGDVECDALALQSFGRSPTYVTRLGDAAHQSQLVYFPARGVWRAVSRRGQVGEGAVLKGPDERIFVLQGGRRRWVPSLDTFAALGLQWDQIQLASFEELARIPEGLPITAG